MNTQGGHLGTVARNTLIALFLVVELVTALRTNAPDAFKRWLFRGVQDPWGQLRRSGLRSLLWQLSDDFQDLANCACKTCRIE